MDLPENKMGSMEVDDLRQEVDSLRQLVTGLLILLIVVSGTLNIYLLRQAKSVHQELPALRAQAAQVQRAATSIDTFLHDLLKYGSTHSDFAPVMARHGLDKLPKPADAMPSAPSPSQKK